MPTQSANLDHKGFDPRKVISRPFFKLRFSTWEVFKNPCLKKEGILDQILKNDVGTSLSFNEINLDELSRILKQLENKIRNKNWKKLVDYHCRKQVLQNQEGSNGMKKIITIDKRGLVSLFRAIGHDILPKKLFLGNQRKFLAKLIKSMYILITAPGKNSPVLLNQLCQRLEPSMLPWMSCVSNDTNIQQIVLAKIVSWLASNVFWRAITGFFITIETAFGKNEIEFVRKRDIHSILIKEISRLSTLKHIKLIPNKRKIESILSLPNAPSIARCRFLLKKNGSTRLICMKKKVTDRIENIDIKNKGAILSYAAQQLPGLVDVKGVQFYTLWRNFIAQVKQGINSKIYVIVSDIKDAYGSVNHDKLVSVVNRLKNKLPEQIYIHDVKYTYPSSSKFRLFHRRIPSPDKHFNLTYPFGAVPYKDNQPSSTELNVKEILNSVCLRIKLHTLKFTVGKRKKVYLLNHGLVQGDCLSVPLCNLYYGDMTSRHLSDFLDQQYANNTGHQRIFARGMDDFIFATTDKSEADRFLNRMSQGFPDYECKIRNDKTMTSFEHYDMMKGHEIVFCGAIIDPVSYSCRPDFSVYVDKNIAYSTTFNDYAFDDAYGFILQRMLFLVVLKLQPLYFDESFNGRDRVLKNSYEIHYISALRLHSMIDSLILVNGLKINLDRFSLIIKQCGKKSKRHYNKMCNKYSVKNQTVTPIEIRYLFILAIYKMQCKKGGSYGKEVNLFLKKELGRHQIKNAEELHNIANIALKDSHLLNIKSHAYQKII